MILVPAITGIMIGVRNGSAKWIADTFATYGKKKKMNKWEDWPRLYMVSLFII